MLCRILPNTARWLSRCGVAATVTKNCELPVVGPRLAIDRMPGPLCKRRVLSNSSTMR